MIWTTSTEGKKLVEELSREVIAETAPEEIAVFDELVEVYYQKANPSGSAGSDTDDALGFGVDAGLFTVLTPAVLAVVTEVINYFRDEVIKSAKEEGAITIRAKIKAVLNPALKSEVDPSRNEKSAAGDSALESDFSKEQLLVIQKIVKREAKKYGIKEDNALKLANAVIGRLVIS
jgi:hypothetical protein